MVQKTNKQTQLPRRTVGDRIDFLERMAISGMPDLLKVLPGAFEDRSPTVRDKAVLLVTEHGLTEALPLVELLLRDNSEDVRYDAAECVGMLGKRGKSSHPGLRALLSDKSALVRAQAAESLALMGDQGALPKVARLLGDRAPFVRSYAAAAIGDMGGFKYLQRIRRVLRNEQSERARVGLLEALFRLGERGVLREFLGLLESPDYHIRCAVANALKLMPLEPSETQLALSALKKASGKPLAVADASTAKRVFRTLRDKFKTT